MIKLLILWPVDDSSLSPEMRISIGNGENSFYCVSYKGDTTAHSGIMRITNEALLEAYRRSYVFHTHQYPKAEK